MTNRPRHCLSHASLLTDVSSSKIRPRQTRWFDAIVVPATRPSALQRIITLSADISVPLVLLCSRQASVGPVAERVRETFGARALVIDVPEGHAIGNGAQATADCSFRAVTGGRSSDLSLKRNLGLLLARLRGWRKILFVDDDIDDLCADDIANLAHQLERSPVAAMRSWSFPDNSVVCHAGRLAGMPQDIFVSGAVLAVNTQLPGLSFFPDIYNEDWFFFAEDAARRRLPKVGEVRQDHYEPFADPRRAAREEFGDLLAEGLYAIFEDRPGWTFREQLEVAARRRYWASFIEDRASFIADVERRLENHAAAGRLVDKPAYSAMESLRYAKKELAEISPQLCVDFIEAWREDTDRWQRQLPAQGLRLGEREALDTLGLGRWTSCGYGAPVREPATV